MNDIGSSDFADVTAWAQEQLGALGAHALRPIELVHVRPWSTVLRTATTIGDVWIKIAADSTMFEPRLIELLAKLDPGRVPPLIAVDSDRGWMMMADGGPTLRTLFAQEAYDIARWEAALVRYAELQIGVAAHANELIALGTPDYRLAKLPSIYAWLLEDERMLRVALPDGLTRDELDRLRSLEAVFERWCENLASFGIPATIQHDDLHDGNIFVRDNGYAFFDWGDACVTHPFFTMVITLRSIAWSFKLREDSAEIAQLRDAYLDRWTATHRRDELLQALDLALVVGWFACALKWHRSLVDVPSDLWEEDDAGAVAECLQMFLAAADRAGSL